jgi:uncharacterized membrane protein
MNTVITLLIIGVIMLSLDFIYLNTFRNMFMKQVQDVQGSPLTLNLVGAIPCYIILITGLYYFIIQPNRSVLDAFLLGLFVYGVYELTTLSIIKKWRLQTVIIDTLWGGLLFATITYIIQNYLQK